MENKKFEATEMLFCGKMIRITWVEHVSNGEALGSVTKKDTYT